MWLGDSAEVAQTLAEEVQHFEESTQVRLGEGLVGVARGQCRGGTDAS